MANSKYYCLSERRTDFKSGYLIIGNTLFQFENGMLYEDWELSGKTIEEKVAEARKAAEISERKRIYYDDQGYYNEDAVLMEGGLNYCDELSEDEQSLAEYWQNH